MVVLSKEQVALRQRARELAQQAFKPTAAHTDQSEQYPWDNVRQLCDQGFMGMTIPVSTAARARPPGHDHRGRGNGEGVRDHGPDHGRGQHGRDWRHHAVRHA